VSFEALSHAPQYSLRRTEKERLLLDELNHLTAHHRAHCAEYARILHLTGTPPTAKSLEEVPFIPVGLFKGRRLASVPSDQVCKTVTSSGTTGQRVSQILLDRRTIWRQTTTLGRIVSHAVGPERIPMLLVEAAGNVIATRTSSARSAGLLGMMNFGRSHFFALNEDMALDEEGLRDFLQRFGGSRFLVVGFTFMIWQYFYVPLRHLGLDLSNGILLHGGGWKALEDRAVSHRDFTRALQTAIGLKRIHNFYGMVEQLGNVHMEAEDGFLYPPNTGDIIIRDPATLAPAPPGTPGLIQVLSALPLSYPGHSILTDDVGVLHGIDDASGGRLGTRFSVLGRVPRAELRGCSDVHAAAAVA
jgi:hypothetical protein